MGFTNIEESFEQARAEAARGLLVIVSDNGHRLALPALPKEAVKPEMIAAVEGIAPSTNKRSIAVISDTVWATKPSPDLRIANQAIPFFGLLMGLTYIGHSVWVFPPENKLLDRGCSGADLLIVDSACIPRLPLNWRSNLQNAIPSLRMLIHDRNTYKLLELRPQ